MTTFNQERAEALRTAIIGTAQTLRHFPDGDGKILLTEHLALLQEAELLNLTDAQGDDEDAEIALKKAELRKAQDQLARWQGTDDPHAELRKTWAPGQRWQMKTTFNKWKDLATPPGWHSNVEYRRHPDDIDQPPKPWYPDGSGEWVEVPADCMECPVPKNCKVQTILLRERQRAVAYNPVSATAGNFSWDRTPADPLRIVAYKVVR